MGQLDQCRWQRRVDVGQQPGLVDADASQGLGRSAGLRAAAVAVGAFFGPGDVDLLFAAEGRFFKAQRQADSYVLPALGAGLAAAALPAEGASEEGIEDVAQVKIFKSAIAACAARRVIGIDARMAELVVARLFVLVGQNLVRGVDLFHFLLGLFVARIEVGVVFFGQFSIGFLDFFVGCALFNFQYLVKVALLFRHMA